MSENERVSSDRKHIPALDGVRGLAILLVVLVHFRDVLDCGIPVVSTIQDWLRYAGLGVDLFFVLSGFLITGILVDSVESRSYFPTFYVRRILRIFPLYYFFLFFLYVIRRPLMEWWWNYDSMPGVDLRWHLLYLSNWKPDRGLYPDEATHLWSLAIEEQFYMVWPMIVYLVPRRLLVYVCLAGIATAVGLREVLVLRDSWWEMIHRWTPVRMDTLLMGALMALAYRNDRWRAAIGRLAVPVGVAVVAWFFAQECGWINTLSYSIMRTMQGSTPAVAFACLVFWAATAGRGSRFLTSWPMQALGRYSYGIYMWHLFAPRLLPRSLVEGSGLPVRMAYFLALIVIACGFAFLSWNLLEQPFLRLKSLFPYRYEAPKPAAVDGLKAVGEAG